VGSPIDVFMPITMQPVVMPNEPYLGDRKLEWLLLLGRRKPGVTLEQAEVAFTTLTRRFLMESGSRPRRDATGGEISVDVSSGTRGFSNVRRSYAAPLVTLMVSAGLLLLIICANVANLLLARAVTRSREMSVRLAMGAERARLVRQLLTESLVLALLSAVVGLWVAWWGSRALLSLAAD